MQVYLWPKAVSQIQPVDHGLPTVGQDCAVVYTAVYTLENIYKA